MYRWRDNSRVVNAYRRVAELGGLVDWFAANDDYFYVWIHETPSFLLDSDKSGQRGVVLNLLILSS